ncbi:hypothetical protein BSU04_10685 [Caballeronia sordidicola]|uniref:Uncharacterized protein n=1 Tax=Caballeronia sordidicola TaxID=196367 RepID=A0A226X5G2_CABSO|nr:hypothetical protein BSU04_10685 [Caballeronia sordidicola]
MRGYRASPMLGMPGCCREHFSSERRTFLLQDQDLSTLRKPQ